MFAKNARHHSAIGRVPFMAQMGYEARLGAQTLNLDKDILEGVVTEEQLAQMMPELQKDIFCPVSKFSTKNVRT